MVELGRCCSQVFNCVLRMNKKCLLDFGAKNGRFDRQCCCNGAMVVIKCIFLLNCGRAVVRHVVVPPYGTWIIKTNTMMDQ